MKAASCIIITDCKFSSQNISVAFEKVTFEVIQSQGYHDIDSLSQYCLGKAVSSCLQVAGNPREGQAK